VQNAKQQGLANRIDRSVLTNFSGSAQTQLITALRFLGLTDSKGHPTERMSVVVAASGTDEWPSALAALLRDSYPTLFDNFDLAAASPNQFSERFRTAFPAADSVLRKAATFFLGAAQDAKIPISGHITKNKKPRSAGTAGRRRSTKAARATTTPPPTDAQPPSHTANGAAPPKAPNAYELLAVLDMSDMEPAEQAAVWTLIQYLKKKEAGVSVATRQRRDNSKSRSAAAVSIPEIKEAPDGTALAE
jgi:hypothetical protein